MSYDPTAADPLNAKPDWEAIHDCGIWKVLGVGECNNCPDLTKCWGPDSLPQPEEERR